VEMIIKKAFDEGKKFRVVVVDSRPKFEGFNFIIIFIIFYLFIYTGKALLASLTQHGVPCTYTMLNGISYIMKEVFFLSKSSFFYIKNYTFILLFLIFNKNKR
jgi:translation initiation factor eIF-2B subunit delta